MTDEQMDARLRAAGETWRAAQSDTRVLDPGEPLDISPRRRANRRSRTGFLLTAAAVAAALAGALTVFVTGLGGGSHRSADVAGLRGTVWRLVSYDDDQRLPNSFATLVINTDGQLVADDSCGLVAARVSMRGNQLLVSDLARRVRECTDTAGEVIFDHGVDILRASPTYTIDGDELSISGAGRTMHLVAAPELPAPTLDVPTLTGTDWQLTKVQGPAGDALPLTGTPRLRIEGTQLQASDTCNTLSGPVTFNEGAANPTGRVFQVTHLATTEIGCPPDVQTTAGVVDAVFSGLVAYHLTGPRLTIFRATAGQLTYVWQPTKDGTTDPAKLADRTWHLLSSAGDRPQYDLTLRFANESNTTAHMTGDDGCHTIWTWVSLHGGWFTARPVAAGSLNDLRTDAASCGSTVHSLLSSKPAMWSVHDGKLVISAGGAQGFALVYGAAPLPRARSLLVGSTWSQESSEITGPGQPTGSASYPYRDDIRLDGHGGITITHRCYVNQGSVTIGKDTLDITHVRLKSAIPCAATAEQAAEQVADANADRVLSGRVSWSIDGELHISKGDSSIDFDR